MSVVPLLQAIRGMCTDEEPHTAIDAKLADAIDLATGACERGGPSGAGTCLRGTVGCSLEHGASLLEQLDAAEAQLHMLEATPWPDPMAFGKSEGGSWVRDPDAHRAAVDARTAAINSGSAHCVAAAARCLVTTERV